MARTRQSSHFGAYVPLDWRCLWRRTLDTTGAVAAILRAAELSPALLGAGLCVLVALVCRRVARSNRDETSQTVCERVMAMVTSLMAAGRQMVAGVCEGVVGGACFALMTGAAVPG